MFSDSNASAQPQWVKQRPLGAGYYIGIGVANLANTNVEDAESTALQIALKEISSQVEVRVESASTLSRHESSDGVDSDYDDNITISTDMEFEDLEIVDIWKNKNEIWVYVRLSKLAYQERIAAHDNRIKSRVMAFFSNYIELQPKSISNRILSLLRAQQLLLTEKIADSSVHFNGATRDVGTLVSAHLVSELERVQISPMSPAYDLRTGSNLAQTVDVLVQQKHDGSLVPVSDMPVHFEFEAVSHGEFANPAISNNDGVASGRVVDFRSKNRRVVAMATVDPLALLRGDSTGIEALEGRIRPLVPPPAVCQIQGTSRVAFFEYDSEPTVSAAMDLLRGALKESIASTGIVYSEELDGYEVADLCSRVKVRLSRDSRYNNIVFVFLVIQIDVYDCYSSDIRLTVGGGDIKAGGRDLNAASNKAVKKFAKKEFVDFGERLLGISLSESGNNQRQYQPINRPSNQTESGTVSE